MDESIKRTMQRLVRRIPNQLLKPTLDKWGRLTAAQKQSLDFTQPKWALTERLLALCEENEWTAKHIIELEMIYVIDNPNQGMWYAFQLMDPEDDAASVELAQFKEQFKSHLRELVKHVSVKIKKHTDEAVWIRIAWGDGFTRPNHLKPTYVVHHLQTPYVFVSSLTSKQKPLLSQHPHGRTTGKGIYHLSAEDADHRAPSFHIQLSYPADVQNTSPLELYMLQALVLSTRYNVIKDANLSGRKLTAIRDLLMRQYQQVFPTKFPSPLTEKNETVSNPCIEKEQSGAAANRLQMACEAFGDGELPQLQSAVYKLETKFKDPTNKTMTEQEEPFKCVIKFASTNLLESLKQCATSGIASTPVTPLLSSIPLKGRNYFVITDNGPGPTTQMHTSQK